MHEETDLAFLIRSMKPELNAGEYAFCTVAEMNAVPLQEVVCFFREKEGYTLILEKARAESYHLAFNFVAAWITLTVHSALDAVGLTAAFSNALAAQDISCNVVAAYFHDHIFVPIQDAERAMMVLEDLAGKGAEQ
ncbi:ACT domain-containing protein [Pontibacter rugosus]|uniref:ACT domain-containing protein n=1 Tax=Pontibacter rugosus TaxID=1745966 RepID=A0ABW3SVX3_9BACT